MKGVELGDMGPKIGFHSKNNGWCSFNHVRIPRDYMFMRFVSVDRQGNFSVKGNMKSLYSVMMGIRTQILSMSAFSLAKMLIIAGRYSVVRRQFKNTKGSELETKLVDYQTQ